MSRFVGVAALISAILLLTGCGLWKKQAPLPDENAGIAAFSYRHTGSSTNEIYSYDVVKEEDSGEIMVNYDLLCGNAVYSFSADDAFIRDVSAIVKEHNLRTWDGFDKRVSGVLDGDGFDLTIRYEDGTEITASGRNCSPDGYSEAARAINDLFREYLKKRGVDQEGG